MAKAREIKRRIRSIDNTRQITKTMEMVAASKLKRAQDRVVAARPFDEFMRQVIGQLRTGAGEALGAYPLLREEPRSGRAAVLVVTSNRGLAGAFNANLVRAARNLLREIESRGLETEVHVIGKKGASMLRYLGDDPATTVTDLSDRPTWPIQAALYHPPGGIIRHDAVVWGYARGADREADLAAWDMMPVGMRDGSGPAERAWSELVSGNYFEELQVRPAPGGLAYVDVKARNGFA